MSDNLREEDLSLLDAIENGRVEFDRARHEHGIRRIAASILGNDVPIPTRSVAIKVREELRELNRKTGECLIALDDASSEEEIALILVSFLAKCGSPLRRRNAIAAAKEYIEKLR